MGCKNMAKTYEELLADSIKQQQKLEEARVELATKIGLEFLKKNPKITSLKKYREYVKANDKTAIILPKIESQEDYAFDSIRDL